MARPHAPVAEEAARKSFRPGSFVNALSGDAYRELVVRHGRPQRFKAGEHLAVQGTLNTPVWFVWDGYVKVVRTAQGDSKPMLIDICGAGAALGIEAAIAGKPLGMSFTVMKDSTVVAVPRGGFLALLEGHYSMTRATMETLARRVHLRDAALAYSAHKVPTRVVAFLARQQIVHGVVENGVTRIDIGLSYPDIAEAIGASTPAVQQVMKNLKNDGVLKIRNKVIYVNGMLQPETVMM